MKKVLAVLAAVGVFGALGSSAHALDVNWTGLGDGVKWSDTDNWDVGSGILVNNRMAIVDQANYSGAVTMSQNIPGLKLNGLEFTGTGSDSLVVDGLGFGVGRLDIEARDSTDVTFDVGSIRLINPISGRRYITARKDASLTLNSRLIVDANRALSLRTVSYGEDAVLVVNNEVVGASMVDVGGRVVFGKNFETTSPTRLRGPGINTAKGGATFADLMNLGTLFTPDSCVRSNDLTFDQGGLLRIVVKGGNSCLGYGRITVSGSVVLGDTSKIRVVSSGPDLVIGDELIIIRNDGSDAVSGTFFGKPEGREITAGPYVYEISYRGGDGNDVSLTVVRIEN